MRKPNQLKVICYVACLIDLNEYLTSFPGSTPTHKIGTTALNEILLYSMPSSWSKQAYVQGFDWKSITLKKSVNVFGRMDITESIYEGTVEPFYKNYWGRCQPCCTYQAK